MLCITQAARKQGVSNMPMIALTGFFRIFGGSRRLRRAHDHDAAHPHFHPWKAARGPAGGIPIRVPSIVALGIACHVLSPAATLVTVQCPMIMLAAGLFTPLAGSASRARTSSWLAVLPLPLHITC